jgi:uncharacterized protein (UPF0548 family)
VTIEVLPPGLAEDLRARPFSYAAVGGTAGEAPAGFHVFARRRTLNHRNFEAAADALMTWKAHRGGGLKVAASSPRAMAGSVVLMRLGIGTLALRIPCRVVYVVDEPDVKGFAYGTLPGHPESGEELFLVRRKHDGSVEFAITAFSLPQSRAARLAGPVGRWGQRFVTGRYLRSLDI